MILKTCILLGTLFLADVPWWDDTTPDDQTKVTAVVKMPLTGGLSSDGKYEICVIGSDPMDHDYAFGFFRPNEKSPLFQVNLNAGFCVLRGASEIDSALWNEDDSLVAIEDHDTRHSMAIHLVLIRDNKALKVIMPPFGKAMVEKTANIRGGAANACGCKPLRWSGRAINFLFSAGAGLYTSEVTMRVIPSNPPRAILVSETPPKETETSISN